MACSTDTKSEGPILAWRWGDSSAGAASAWLGFPSVSDYLAATGKSEPASHNSVAFSSARSLVKQDVFGCIQLAGEVVVSASVGVQLLH